MAVTATVTRNRGARATTVIARKAGADRPASEATAANTLYRRAGEGGAEQRGERIGGERRTGGGYHLGRNRRQRIERRANLIGVLAAEPQHRHAAHRRAGDRECGRGKTGAKAAALGDEAQQNIRNDEEERRLGEAPDEGGDEPAAAPGQVGRRTDQTRRSTIIFLISAIAFAGFRPFGQTLRAVHDRVAAVEAERILQVVEPLAGRLVAAVDQPAIGLEERGGAEIAIARSTSSSGRKSSSRRTGCIRRGRRALGGPPDCRHSFCGVGESVFSQGSMKACCA